jgi:hypothetical protein
MKKDNLLNIKVSQQQTENLFKNSLELSEDYTANER